mgnify:FL=1
MKIINSNENWISQTQNCSIKILLTSGKIWVNQSKKIHPTWKTNGIKSERSMILFINSQSLTSAQIQPRFPDIIPFIAVSYRHLISAISRSKKPTMGYFVVLLQPNVMLDKGWHLLKWPERKERNVFKYLHLFIKTIDRPGWGEEGHYQLLLWEMSGAQTIWILLLLTALAISPWILQMLHTS